MKVLVAVGSKHGATKEIAEEIAMILDAAGLEVDMVEAGEVTSIEPWDAVVLGSAVYAGRWLRDARRVAELHTVALRERPVWAFSSGPIGDPPKPEEDPAAVSDIDELIDPIDHRVFAGRLDRSRLGFGERAIVAALSAPEGDFRNWQQVRDWAEGIAAHLVRLGAATTG